MKMILNKKKFFIIIALGFLFSVLQINHHLNKYDKNAKSVHITLNIEASVKAYLA